LDQSSTAFWSIPSAEMLQRLESTAEGLTDREAQRRLSLYGSNLLTPKKRSDAFTLLLSQFKSPIILILLFATGLSFFLHDHVNALIILVIVLGSGLLGFWQERGAADAVEKLLAIVQLKVPALRDGIEKKIPLEDIVPGDVILARGGEVIPGDCLVLESEALYVDEATLTGETYPVRKSLPSHDQIRTGRMRPENVWYALTRRSDFLADARSVSGRGWPSNSVRILFVVLKDREGSEETETD
jgi:P-type Mg2+ transporter